METGQPVRHIKKVWKSIPTIEGAGVRLKRAFGFHEVPQLDPFLLLVSGKPLKEPVAWYGPIVMNTKEELRTAFQEFEAGTFIKGAALSQK